MKERNSLPALAVALLLTVLPGRAAAAETAAPSAIFRHGKVVTVDAGFSVREALAVRDGRIMAVGTNREITALAKEGVTQVVDLGGHMQKIGDWRAINIYSPFLAMWVTLTRGAKWYEGRLHAAEALSREQAIRFLTRNNAYLLFWEKEIGSLEAGKRADFIVVDRDLLTCPVDDVKDTQVLQTWVEGQPVYRIAAPR